MPSSRDRTVMISDQYTTFASSCFKPLIFFEFLIFFRLNIFLSGFCFKNFTTHFAGKVNYFQKKIFFCEIPMYKMLFAVLNFVLHFFSSFLLNISFILFANCFNIFLLILNHFLSSTMRKRKSKTFFLFFRFSFLLRI